MTEVCNAELKDIFVHSISSDSSLKWDIATLCSVEASWTCYGLSAALSSFFFFFFSRENTQETKVICNLVTLSNAGWVTAIHSMSRERRVKCDRIAEIYEELHKGCDGNFLMSRHGERNQEWKQNLIIKTWRKHNDIQILDLIKCINALMQKSSFTNESTEV